MISITNRSPRRQSTITMDSHSQTPPSRDPSPSHSSLPPAYTPHPTPSSLPPSDPLAIPQWSWAPDTCREWLFHHLIREGLNVHFAFLASKKFEGYGATLYLLSVKDWDGMFEKVGGFPRQREFVFFLYLNPGFFWWGQ